MGNSPFSQDYRDDSSALYTNSNSHDSNSSTSHSNSLLVSTSSSENFNLDQIAIQQMMGDSGYNVELFDQPARRLVSNLDDSEIFALRIEDDVDGDDLKVSGDSDMIDVVEMFNFPVNLDAERIKVTLDENHKIVINGVLDSVRSCTMIVKVGKMKISKNYSEGLEQIVEEVLDYSPEPGTDVPISFTVVEAKGVSQTTLTNLEVNDEYEAYFSIEKQTVSIKNVVYNTYEIYGMSSANEQIEECVICLTEERDTIVIPCRHLCVCHTCADVLKYQSNKCPICRAQTSTMVQILNKSKDTDSMIV